jgi:hypothetical protein
MTVVSPGMRERTNAEYYSLYVGGFAGRLLSDEILASCKHEMALIDDFGVNMARSVSSPNFLSEEAYARHSCIHWAVLGHERAVARNIADANEKAEAKKNAELFSMRRNFARKESEYNRKVERDADKERRLKEAQWNREYAAAETAERMRAAPLDGFDIFIGCTRLVWGLCIAYCAFVVVMASLKILGW